MLDFPSRRTVLFVVAGRERLTAAVSLETMSMQAAKMIGPLLGGLLLARLGPAACYLAFAVLLARRARSPPAAWRGGWRSRASPAGRRSWTASCRVIREVRRHPAILGVLAVTVLMNSLVFPYQQMLPVFARDVLHVGPGAAGTPRHRAGVRRPRLLRGDRRPGGPAGHGRLFVGSSLAGAVLLLAFALSPWYALSLALQLAIGATESGFATMQSAIVLLTAPVRAHGRVMGILSACIGTQPLGSLWLGFLASRMGAPLATGLNAALASVLMVPVALRLMGIRSFGRRRPA